MDNKLAKSDGDENSDSQRETRRAVTALEVMKAAVVEGQKFEQALQKGISEACAKYPVSGGEGALLETFVRKEIERCLVKSAIKRMLFEPDFSEAQGVEELLNAGFSKEGANYWAAEISRRRPAIQEKLRETLKERMLARLLPTCTEQGRVTLDRVIDDLLMRQKGTDISEQDVLDSLERILFHRTD